jgi:hypothetical protein
MDTGVAWWNNRRQPSRRSAIKNMARNNDDKTETSKTIIIERIFDARWDSLTTSLKNDLVTYDDLREAIREFDQDAPEGLNTLGSGNVYAFFKDIVRVTERANRMWPRSVLERGFTARQETGGGKAFRFIKFPAEQLTPFIEQKYPRLPGEENRFRIQSLSLDIKSRLLGRRDESWLMQVAVKLRLIQSHLALWSEHKFVEVSDLQQNIKQYGAEIDGLFLGKVTADNAMVITVEAKRRREAILDSQIAAQVGAVMRMGSIHRNLDAIAGTPEDFYVLPMALKVVGDSVVYIAEYERVKYQHKLLVSEVNLIRESICEITPPVEGIG